MDETTTRTVEKSCVAYVRFLQDNQPKTSYYCLLNMGGGRTTANIVEKMGNIWYVDGLDPMNSCWFHSENVSTFTGTFESS